MENRNSFKDGLKRSMPIVTGYVPISMAYGVIGMQAGVSFWALIAMSFFVYAGAGQFMAVNLFAIGASPLEMTIAVGVLNFRHFVMGLSFQTRIKSNQFNKVLLSLGLTDETFALLSLDENVHPAYAKGVMLGSYLSWTFGTIAGIFFGNIIPETLSKGLEIGIFTLFITLLVSSLEGRLKMVYIPMASMVTNTILSTFLSSGISILLSILVGAAFGTVIGGNENE